MSKINIIYKRKIALQKKSILTRNSLNCGFTLVELLIAGALSFVVLGGATFGITEMIRRNDILQQRSQQRTELDRAINYIADEIKQANDVQIVQSGSTFPGSGTGVLWLTIPTDTANPQRVYFIRPSTDNWVKPYTINRSSGTISNPATVTSGDNVLVDGITKPSDTQLAGIQELCDTNGDKKTDLQGDNGFYACINETTNTVNLYLYGRLQRSGYVTGNQKDDPTLENLAVTTTVSARGTLTP